MKTRKILLAMPGKAALVAVLAFGLLLAGCPTSVENRACTVTFDAQDGSGDLSTTTVPEGDTIGVLPAPTRNGYTFKGWYTQTNGGGSQFTSSTPVNGNLTVYAKWTSGSNDTSQEGVYIGIISFAGEAIDLATPTLLDSTGRDNLINKINSDYTISSQGGTALFYGAHKALANLTNMTTYPDKLDFVNVITFTDGLDNGSTGRSALNPIEDQTFDTEAEYASYVDNQIDSRTIGGKSITAYSVGVRGEDIDVSDLTKFQNNLQNIASPGNDSQGNPYAIELTDFSKLQATFTAIADSLQVVENTSTNFNMKTTLLSSGTKVRMTFDVTGISSSDAMGSSKYIEGSITRTGTGASLTYTFNNITYSGGLGSDQNAGPITGVIDGSEVTFAFTGMSGYIPATDESRAKQWAMAPSTATWQVNSEYSISGATDTQVEKRSAIIYLVLDASTSLSAPQIGQIRTAAIGFINSIYSRLSSSASVSLITNQWYTNSFTSSSQTHTYQFYATAGTTYRIAWDDSYEGSGAYTCDVKVSASGAGITPFSDVDTAYSTPRTITPSSSGNITITVIPFSSGGTGSYRIIRGY